MLRCAVSVLKLAIAVPVSARNITATTANAALHLAAVALSRAAKWLRQWRKLTSAIFPGYNNTAVVSNHTSFQLQCINLKLGWV